MRERRRKDSTAGRRATHAGAWLALAAVLVLAGPADAGGGGIVNGLPTAGFPPVGALIDSLGSFCSATLIGCGKVLTAAHCLCSPGNTGDFCPDGTQLPDPSAIFFFLQQAGFFSVSSITVHPSFSFGVTADFAVLQLGVPVRGVDPAPINMLAPAYSSPGTIVGFGRSSGVTPDSGMKRFGSVDTGSCAGAGVPEPAHVCWTFQTPIGDSGDDSTTCGGDSGGPLFVDVGAGLGVAGVHSGGTNPSCAATDVAYDANVFAEHTWIEGQAGVDLSEVCGDGPVVGDPSVTVYAVDDEIAVPDDLDDPYDFSVPAGTQELRVTLNGEDGNTTNDFDLFVRFGAPATENDFDCASTLSGTFESCTISQPLAGTWHVLVDRFAGEGDYQLTATMLPESPAPPTLAQGDVLVTDFASSELMQVDAATGDRAIASSPLRGAGLPPVGPEGVVAEENGPVWITDRDRRALFRVDPATGDRSLVSGCVDSACTTVVGSGPGFDSPRLLALEDDGKILVTDLPPASFGVLLRVDPATGDRTLASGCPNLGCTGVVGTGPTFFTPLGLAIESSGDILVADGSIAALFRVDPVTGDRTVLSGCPDVTCAPLVGAGGSFSSPLDVALESSGDILVTDAGIGSTFRALHRVDPATGDRSRISGCLDDLCTMIVGAGPDFTGGLSALAIESSGDVLVTDFVANSVLRVDPVTGDRTVWSGCEGTNCVTAEGTGTLFTDPVGIAVVPEPRAWLSLAAGIAGLIALARLRRRTRA